MQVICAEDCRSTAWTWCGQARGPGVASGKRASLARVPAPPPKRAGQVHGCQGPNSLPEHPGYEPSPQAPPFGHHVSEQGSNARRQQQSRTSRGCSPAGCQVAASKRSEAAPGWRPLGTSTPRTATGQPLSCRGSPWTAEPGSTLRLQRSPGCS